jgi:hypothetical protein
LKRRKTDRVYYNLLKRFSAEAVLKIPPALILLTSFAAGTKALLTFEVYSGKAFNASADVLLHEPEAGTEITLFDVQFNDRSLVPPPYWGARLSYYHGDGLSPGAALDFVHAKAIADTGRGVYVRGREKNEPLEGLFPIRRFLSRLELSHGNNLFLLEGLMGYRPARLGGRCLFYAGGGAGPALLHVEVTTPTQSVFEYQWDWCWGALAGARFRFWRRGALFTEYKYTRGRYELDLPEGSVEMAAAANHLTGGLAFQLL